LSYRLTPIGVAGPATSATSDHTVADVTPGWSPSSTTMPSVRRSTASSAGTIDELPVSACGES
jgi:hypothetical protein